MMTNVQESLAGRVGILRLCGLTQGEKSGQADSPPTFDIRALQEKACIRQFSWGLQNLKRHLWLGTMPRSSTAPHLSDPIRNACFSSFMESYLMRDIAALGRIQDEGRFRDFLQACAALPGQQLNFTNLTEAAGVSQPTARRWLDLLAGLSIICLLPAYADNALKRLAKTPKLYFPDTGFAAWLTKWPTSETLWNGAAAGAFLKMASSWIFWRP